MLEITAKGKRALEEDYIREYEGSTSDTMIMILVLVSRGLKSLSEIQEEVSKNTGSLMNPRIPPLIEKFTDYLVRKDYLIETSDREEELPEAFSDFKDHF